MIQTNLSITSNLEGKTDKYLQTRCFTVDKHLDVKYIEYPCQQMEKSCVLEFTFIRYFAYSVGYKKTFFIACFCFI